MTGGSGTASDGQEPRPSSDGGGAPAHASDAVVPPFSGFPFYAPPQPTAVTPIIVQPPAIGGAAPGHAPAILAFGGGSGGGVWQPFPELLRHRYETCLHHTDGVCPGCGEKVKAADPKKDEPRKGAPPKISLVAQTRAPPEYRLVLEQLLAWIESDATPAISIAALAITLLNWPVEELERRLATVPPPPPAPWWKALFPDPVPPRDKPYPLAVLRKAQKQGLLADTFVTWAEGLFPKGSQDKAACRVSRDVAREMVGFVQQLGDNVYAGPVD